MVVPLVIDSSTSTTKDWLALCVYSGQWVSGTSSSLIVCSCLECSWGGRRGSVNWVSRPSTDNANRAPAYWWGWTYCRKLKSDPSSGRCCPWSSRYVRRVSLSGCTWIESRLPQSVNMVVTRAPRVIDWATCTWAASIRTWRLIGFEQVENDSPTVTCFESICFDDGIGAGTPDRGWRMGRGAEQGQSALHWLERTFCLWWWRRLTQERRRKSKIDW